VRLVRNQDPHGEGGGRPLALAAAHRQLEFVARRVEDAPSAAARVSATVTTLMCMSRTLAAGVRASRPTPESVRSRCHGRRMKLLTATHERQGEQSGDFCHATEGELVLAGFVCATDQLDPDGGCGCGRAFSGMSSLRATTTALVRDLDLTPDDVRLAVEGYYVAAGMGPEVIGPEEFAAAVAEELDIMVRIAAAVPAGAVVGRRLDNLVWRSEPTPAGDR